MFKGSNVALITPFKDNKLDKEAYVKLIHFHLENGTHGLVPAGTTGESPTLNHEEHEQVIEICIKESNGKYLLLQVPDLIQQRKQSPLQSTQKKLELMAL